MSTELILTTKIRQCVNKLFISDANPHDIEQFEIYKDKESIQDTDHIKFSHVKKLCDILNSKSSQDDYVYLHELLEGTEICLPSPQIPDQNTELQDRLLRLKLEQDKQEYTKMTKNLTSPDNNSLFAADDMKTDLKALNRHLAQMLNFVLTVGAGFAFGYQASGFLAGYSDVASKVFCGLACGIIIFLTDLYFLVRNME